MAGVLRHACIDERLSVQTFSARLEMVYAARTRAELDRLLNDMPEPTIVGRTLIRIIAWAARWSNQITIAWRAPRTTRMVLPRRECVVIGRSAMADFVVADATVSARHAVLTYADGSWALKDAGSRNGTYVNGWRVVDQVLVRPGDEVTVGETRFVLAAPAV